MKQNSNPLDKLVKDEVITQDQANAVMEKVRPNRQKSQTNQPQSTQQENNGQTN